VPPQATALFVEERFSRRGEGAHKRPAIRKLRKFGIAQMQTFRCEIDCAVCLTRAQRCDEADHLGACRRLEQRCFKIECGMEVGPITAAQPVELAIAPNR
jgi:hypothetical protein